MTFSRSFHIALTGVIACAALIMAWVLDYSFFAAFFAVVAALCVVELLKPIWDDE
jgi:hypothetical protein